MRYRIWTLCFLFLMVGGSLAACGQGAAGEGQAGSGGKAIPVFAVSEAVVGRNRIALGLVRDNTPVNDPNAKVHLRFYDMSDTSATVKAEADATYFGEGLPVGVYVAYPEFDKAGEWQVQVDSQLAGQTEPSTSRLRFEVSETSVAPNVGDKAISAKTPTAADVPLEQLSSGTEPNPAVYQISLDQALESGKPTALLFATPAFCRTATCGPGVEVLESLQQKYADRMNFIHVEVYRYPFAESAQRLEQAAFKATQENRQLTAEEATAEFSDAMQAWGLPTEPWLFLIDAGGIIQARYEGGITQEELAPALDKLLAGEPVL